MFGAQKFEDEDRELYDLLIAAIRSDFLLAGLGFDFDVDFSSRLELHFLSVIIDQLIGDSNFPIQVVRALYGDLRFLRFS